VWGVPRGGGSLVTVATNVTVPQFLAADSSGVYWTSIGPTSGDVGRATPVGSAPAVFSPSQANPLGITSDETNIYWVDSVASGAVMLQPRTGNAVTSLAGSQSYPNQITTDGTNLYWTTTGASSTNSVGTVVQTGIAFSNPKVLASAQLDPGGIAVDSTSVYWTVGQSSAAGMILQTAIGGGAKATLASSQGGPRGIVTDFYVNPAGPTTTVYWTNSGDGTVCSVLAQANAPVVTLATGQKGPQAIAIDATSLYWVNTGTAANTYNDGSVMKLTLK